MLMVRLTELESAVWGVGVPCFIQLNYRRILCAAFFAQHYYYTRNIPQLQVLTSEYSVNKSCLIHEHHNFIPAACTAR